MRKVTTDKRRGIRWKFTTVLEDLDFVDDIALLSFKFNDLREKTERLVEEAARVGLKLIVRKCKALRTEHANNRKSIVVNGREVEDVEEFPYLGATVDKEGRGSKDIMNRLQKARRAFWRLGKVCAVRLGIRRRTKICLFKTLIRPVLLCGFETWKITKSDERKLNSFQCRNLRRIMKITWQQRMTNKRVVEMAGINEISCEVRRRRWNWLGHVLRREGENWAWDSRRTKSERETKDHLEKNCCERERQRRVEDLECSQGSGTGQSVGLRMCRPYAPTGAGNLDDDNEIMILFQIIVITS